MEDAERFRLLFKYKTPRFRIGQKAFCEVRDEMTITGMTEAPIPWPIAKGGRGRHSLVVYKGLDRAACRESLSQSSSGGAPTKPSSDVGEKR